MLTWGIQLRPQYEAQLELLLFSWLQSSAGNSSTLKQPASIFQLLKAQHVQLSMATLTLLPDSQWPSTWLCKSLQTQHGGLVLCSRLRQCYRGRWLLSFKTCSQRGALCHLCCSPGRKEECEHQSGSHQSFQYETSPTYDHWGLVETHGCCTERLAVL